MRRNIQVGQSVELEPVEAQGARAQWHLGELGPPLRVELVAVHPDIARRVTVPDDARQQDERGHDLAMNSTHPNRGVVEMRPWSYRSLMKLPWPQQPHGVPGCRLALQ